MSKVVIGIIIAVVIVLGGIIAMNVTVTKVDTTTSLVSSTNTTTYTIEGEVVKPGTYVLSEGIVMSDLIEAAGGITSNTDELSYFETASLTASTTYYIGSKYDNTDVCNSSEITKVNINKDSASELTTISGITSSVASSIVSYRTENGAFNTIEDLLEVYGIGNATYRKIRNYVILHE